MTGFRAMRIGITLALVTGAGSALAQSACQQALNMVSRLEGQAVGQARADAAPMLQAAQNYRTFYNKECTGKRGGNASGGSSGGGTDKAAAIGQIMSGIAGMAAIMEQRRQRQINEGRESALQFEIEQMQRDMEANQRRAEEQLKVQRDKELDDRRRTAMRNPFLDDKGQIPDSDNPFAPKTAGYTIGSDDNPFAPKGRATYSDDNPFKPQETTATPSCGGSRYKDICELLVSTKQTRADGYIEIPPNLRPQLGLDYKIGVVYCAGASKSNRGSECLYDGVKPADCRKLGGDLVNIPGDARRKASQGCRVYELAAR